MAVSYFAEDVEIAGDKKERNDRLDTSCRFGVWERNAAISAYIFCSDEKILEVNKAYLQHDYYTDVITFDYTEGDKIPAVIYLSAWILSVPMRNSSEPIMTKSFIGLSYTVFCICAVSTIKARVSVR